jgi:hypothetical protein
MSCVSCVVVRKKKLKQPKALSHDGFTLALNSSNKLRSFDY